LTYYLRGRRELLFNFLLFYKNRIKKEYRLVTAQIKSRVSYPIPTSHETNQILNHFGKKNQ
jgi:hypothetical protein